MIDLLKKIFLFTSLLLIIFISTIFTSRIWAQKTSSLSSITVINLLRGKELGHEKDNLSESLKAQWKVTKDAGIPAAWLWQYSTLEDKSMTNFAKANMPGQEFGLLLEIDRNFAQKSNVVYRGQGPSYFSDGLLLVSYDTDERIKLIDTAFAKFKKTFDYYPKTVGAWWIGGDSISYMQKKYGIVAALKASDQFDLDVYSIWGTPWSIPYLSSKENGGIPASSWNSSSKVVNLQWAARDPTRGYEDPLYSIQDYPIKGYDSSYVDYLSSIYLKKPLDNIVIGLENGGSLEVFNKYYKTIIGEAQHLKKNNKADVILSKDYAEKFLSEHKVFSNNHYSLTKDYKSNDQSFWYNCENFRAAVQKIGENIYLTDLRDYSNKIAEDFTILPNSQGRLWIKEPAIIDSMSFPDKKILITKSSEQMQIKIQDDGIALLSGNKKIGFFNSEKTQIFTDENTKTFTFKTKQSGMNLLYYLLVLYVLYFIVLLSHKKNLPKSLVQMYILLIPLLIASPFLIKASIDNPTFVFDRKELLLFHFFPTFYSPSIVNIILFFKLIPFVILIACHYFLTIIFSGKFNKIFYFIILGFVTALYINIPYFPLDRSTYGIVASVFGLTAFVIFIFAIRIFRKTKSTRLFAVSLITIPITLLLLSVIILVSRTELVLAPFEIEALQLIKDHHKNVLYISQIDYSVEPIYKAVKPLIYENYYYAEKLTSARWKNVRRPADHILKITNYENLLIVIPRYLGSDLSPFEIKNLKLKKIFDNAQIAIYEKI